MNATATTTNTPAPAAASSTGLTLVFSREIGFRTARPDASLAATEPPPPLIEPEIGPGDRALSIRAQTPEAFTLAVPLTVEIMTNVAVRAD